MQLVNRQVGASKTTKMWSAVGRHSLSEQVVHFRVTYVQGNHWVGRCVTATEPVSINSWCPVPHHTNCTRTTRSMHPQLLEILWYFYTTPHKLYPNHKIHASPITWDTLILLYHTTQTVPEPQDPCIPNYLRYFDTSIPRHTNYPNHKIHASPITWDTLILLYHTTQTTRTTRSMHHQLLEVLWYFYTTPHKLYPNHKIPASPITWDTLILLYHITQTVPEPQDPCIPNYLRYFDTSIPHHTNCIPNHKINCITNYFRYFEVRVSLLYHTTQDPCITNYLRYFDTSIPHHTNYPNHKIHASPITWDTLILLYHTTQTVSRTTRSIASPITSDILKWEFLFYPTPHKLYPEPQDPCITSYLRYFEVRVSILRLLVKIHI